MRRKTRNLLRKNLRQRGKISISRFFAVFKPGDKVLLNAEPAYQKGMYYPRYYGKVGCISAKQGECYLVTIADQSVLKTLIIHPVHLRRV